MHTPPAIPASTDRALPRFPCEVVVENDDGTVSILAHVSVIDGSRVRARRAGDKIRMGAPD